MSERRGTRSSSVVRLWWGVLALVVAAALLTDLGRVITGASVEVPAEDPGTATRVVRFFSYFTIQSNLLVLVSTIPLVRDPAHDGSGWRVLRLAALMGITVTGLVYAVVLRPTLDPVGLGEWTNAGLHYVSPVMAVGGWLLFGPRPRVTVTTVGWALVWPLVWVAHILRYGTASGWYPYPFLDVADLGYAVALRNTGVVAVGALVFLLLIRELDHRLPRAPRELSPVARTP